MADVDERHERIREHLGFRAFVSTHELAAVTGVSGVTVRRDLRVLEEHGVVVRDHGGARLAEDLSAAEERFAVRETLNTAAKVQIGTAVAGLIRRNERIALNDGTTIMQIALALSSAEIPVVVSTNALNVALRLAQSDNINVYLAGGFVRKVSFGTTPSTSPNPEPFDSDVAILGTNSLSLEGIGMEHPADLAVAQAMIENTSRVIIAADHSKWHRPGRLLVATWDRVDVLVTDTAPSRQASDVLSSSGVEMISSDVGY
jgi:DeoR/GlpR family transcriptional regulator of sugar metabolism